MHQEQHKDILVVMLLEVQEKQLAAVAEQVVLDILILLVMLVVLEVMEQYLLFLEHQ